jgi:hypothetical protein
MKTVAKYHASAKKVGTFTSQTLLPAILVFNSPPSVLLLLFPSCFTVAITDIFLSNKCFSKLFELVTGHFPTKSPLFHCFCEMEYDDDNLNWVINDLQRINSLATLPG